MALRLFSLVVIALSLASCADGGFNGLSRQYSGVLLWEFEGSTFVEGATGIPSVRPAYDKTDWLDWTEWPHLESLMDKSRWDRDCHRVQPFRITFVGRRTHYPIGGAGHWGLWRSNMTVLKPISAERLGPSFCYRR